MSKEILDSKESITINKNLLRSLALNSKLQRSDLRIYLFLLSLNKAIYQRELIELAKKSWSELEMHIPEPKKFVGDFRAEVVCRSIKNLTDLKLVNQVKKEGNNKFLQAETDISAIFE